MAQDSSIETFEFRSESNEPEGYQAFTVDWTTGIIRGQASGFWSMKLVGDHLDKWIACVERIHRSGFRVRVLTDVRQSGVQSRDVAEFLSKATADLYRPDDRIALVFSNSLLKMQMRRLLATEFRQFFISMDAAETWLMAFGDGSGAVLPRVAAI